MKKFGLIGYPLKHSFSAKYFGEKFDNEHIKDVSYELFVMENIRDFQQLIKTSPELRGLNVTIPFKEKIIPLLHEVDKIAKEIGAVNCIKISNIKQKGFFLKGYNTDAIGFEKSIKTHLKPYHHHALILGNGGSAKAITYILKKLNINYLIATRNPVESNHIPYNEIDEDIIKKHLLIINATPLGMFPNVQTHPDIPYQYINDKHFLYDLVYNPEETFFLNKGKLKGAQVKNGLSMLYFQAEESWKIWNNEDI